MPKLIGIDPGAAKRVTHKKCGAIIEYFEREVEKSIHYDYGGGSDPWWHIKCPNCGETVEVSEPKY